MGDSSNSCEPDELRNYFDHRLDPSTGAVVTQIEGGKLWRGSQVVVAGVTEIGPVRNDEPAGDCCLGLALRSSDAGGDASGTLSGVGFC